MTLSPRSLSTALLALAVLSACAPNGAATAQPAAESASGLMPPDAARRDIALARATLERLHPGYDRYASHEALDALWGALEARADDISRETLFVEISRVVAAIRCDHTKTELPLDIEAQRSAAAGFLPLRFVLIEGRAIVTHAAPGVDLQEGDEILDIDGQSMTSWYAQLEPLIATDGDNTLTQTFDFAGSSEYLGSAFEQFAPYLAEAGPQAVLTVQRTTGEAERLIVDRIDFEAFQAITGEQRYGRNFIDAVSWERVGDRGAILRVDTFVNYRRPADPDQVYGPIFAALAEEGRDRLIVDLRRNGGGSTDAQLGLQRRLIDGPTPFAEDVLVRTGVIDIPAAMRAQLDTWQVEALDPDPAWFAPAEDPGFLRITSPEAGAPSSEPLQPSDDAFAGEFALLTGPVNASGVAHMLAALEIADRGVRIGETTGGAPTGATAGVLAYLTLPESGVRIRVPLQRTVIAQSDQLPARTGLTPDIAAPMTVEAFRAGEDPALDAALSALGLE